MKGMDPSEHRMNLAALQRIDPYIKTILMSASQVALYRYVNQEWKKTDAEGTLFVYERKCEPFYGFLILNRLSADNWIQPINVEMDSQINPPFLLYKTKDAEIYGIWFYEEEKCRTVGRAIDQYAREAEERSSSGVKKSAATAPGSMDLSALLTKAAGSKSHPPVTTTKESPSGGEKLLRLLTKAEGKQMKKGPEEMTGAPPPATSVMEFFAQASQQEQQQQQLPLRPPGVAAGSGDAATTAPAVLPHPLVRPVMGPVPTGIVPIMQGVPPGMALLPQQPGAPPVLVPILRPPQPDVMMAPPPVSTMGGLSPPPPNAQNIPPIQSILSNPGAVSLESLERQHREESCTPPSALSSGTQASKDLEADLKSKLNITPGSGSKKQPHHRSNQPPKNLNNNHSTTGTTKTSYAEALVSPPQPIKVLKRPPVEIPATATVAIDDGLDGPHLLSPMMFSQPSVLREQDLNGGVNGGLKSPDITPLTKTQLVQAMQHLLRTDPSFVGKLHQAYVESMNTKLN